MSGKPLVGMQCVAVLTAYAAFVAYHVPQLAWQLLSVYVVYVEILAFVGLALQLASYQRHAQLCALPQQLVRATTDWHHEGNEPLHAA